MNLKPSYVLVYAILAGMMLARPGAGQNPGPETNPPASVNTSAGAETKAAAPQNPAGPPTDYVIGPEDLVNINVFDVPDLGRTVRVAYDGTVVLPGIGPIRASGYTPDEFAKELERRWGQTYLVNPQVSIFVQESHSQPVSVMGAVEKPGVYEIHSHRNLVEMLSEAGGLAKIGTAPGRWVYVTRRNAFMNDFVPADGIQLVSSDKVQIDIHKLLYSPTDALNIAIRPFDTISVSVADVIYVVGDVKKPGGYALDEHETLTVLQALAMAGGPDVTAARKRARIIRRKADGSRQEIPLDIGKVMDGKAGDPELAANDILFVPSSTSKSAAKKGADAVLGTLSGMLIYGRL
jgi:polysaccharide biosynthesis/export protein